jgi:hypothetical protein
MLRCAKPRLVTTAGPPPEQGLRRHLALRQFALQSANTADPRAAFLDQEEHRPKHCRAGSIAAFARLGAAHTYVPPVVLGAVGVIAGADLAVQLALIWITHIGVDRAVGYGLKYPSSFKETHLQERPSRARTPSTPLRL